MKLEFKKMGINGEGIGFLQKKPVFCDDVYPGETAEIEITEQNPSYARAKLIRRILSSEHRINSVCPHQQECGSCPLLCLERSAQEENKLGILRETLYRYAGIKSLHVRKMHGDTRSYGYRSACKLPVAEVNGKLCTGMYARNSNRFIPVDHCPIHTPELEEKRRQILEILNHHKYPVYTSKSRRGLRFLVIRTIQGQTQCTLVTGKETIPEVLIQELSSLPGISGIFQSINQQKNTRSAIGSVPRLLYGAPAMTIEICGITLNLPPDAFFQLNIEQAERLYTMAVSKIDPCDLLVEAYCGVGAMSLMAAAKAKRIIGIENVSAAVEYARHNAVQNGIQEKTQFICEDAAKGLTGIKEDVGCLLVDPPRSGLSDEMMKAILDKMPQRIVYISCNPATLAKNLNQLKRKYHILTILPYDLFPSTQHIETIAVLSKM
ncbi:MAG: 23S rRNA (uracil(1939)-C(5))-methyltransferase RlmD [Solobacterium sp.]|nr:23S rRNA (uracil(1939)-C(5))-methyltransferase RlmD [Solobacterium sp.]